MDPNKVMLSDTNNLTNVKVGAIIVWGSTHRHAIQEPNHSELTSHSPMAISAEKTKLLKRNLQGIQEDEEIIE